MSKTNLKAKDSSAQSRELSAFERLQRTINTCLLWEDSFYEDGVSISDRIRNDMHSVTKEEAEKLLNEAKFDNNLRHVPLYILCCMAENKMLSSSNVYNTITRVDDMSELLSMYWKLFRVGTGKKLPKQMVKGLKKSFGKFNEYQFGKYKGLKDEIKLRDVIRIIRPEPETQEQSNLWKKIVSNTLATPDTWEVELSKSKDKSSSWKRLVTERTDDGKNKLGTLALLRNLRNVIKYSVPENDIRNAVTNASMTKILPFQIIKAGQYAPFLTDILETKLFESIDNNVDKLDGDTILLLDVSGSMDSSLSEKSDCNRIDAGAGVMTMIDRVCEKSYKYLFTNENRKVPNSYHGFSLIDYIASNKGGGTSVIDCTNNAINEYKDSHNSEYPKRVIVITDEQTNSDYQSSKIQNLKKGDFGYIVNVGEYEKGVAYNSDSNWVHISGWSDGILKFISKFESSN